MTHPVRIEGHGAFAERYLVASQGALTNSLQFAMGVLEEQLTTCEASQRNYKVGYARILGILMDTVL